MYKLKLNDENYDALTKAELVNLILSWDDLANSPAGTQEEAQYDFCQLVKNFYQIFDYTDLKCNYFVDEDTADECFNYIKGTSKKIFLTTGFSMNWLMATILLKTGSFRNGMMILTKPSCPLSLMPTTTETGWSLFI